MAETILESGVFMNVPSHLITDILAKLPPKAVIRCGCVCKDWLNLISQSEFVSLHLSKSPTCLIVHQFSRLFDNSATFSLVQVEDETDHHGVRPIAGTNREIPRNPVSTGMTMIGSIDGLICINEFALTSELIRVWNPYMREFITVQTPSHTIAGTYGFGTRSGKYVVVRIYQKINDRQQICDSVCHVYTIGDGVWKSIGHAPYLYRRGDKGLFFNGYIHWFTYDKDSPQRICRLDLEKELFQPFPPPPELSERHIATLNLYNGCLSVCDVISDSYIVIWVMKEYELQNSWSKEVVISKVGFFANFYAGFHIIKVFKDGGILFLRRYCYEKLYLYHPKRKTVEYIDAAESMTGRNENCMKETNHYVSSIVSLKSLGEVNVSRS